MVLACIILFSFTIVVGQSEREKEEAGSAKNEKGTISKTDALDGPPGDVKGSPSMDRGRLMKESPGAGDAKKGPSKKQGWIKRLFSRKTTKEPPEPPN